MKTKDISVVKIKECSIRSRSLAHQLFYLSFFSYAENENNILPYLRLYLWQKTDILIVDRNRWRDITKVHTNLNWGYSLPARLLLSQPPTILPLQCPTAFHSSSGVLFWFIRTYIHKYILCRLFWFSLVEWHDLFWG